MIRSGLVSITFRDLSPAEIVRLAARSGLDGVEWGGATFTSRTGISAGIDVTFEFHGGTLTDTNASAIALLKEIDHPNVKTYWQPSVAASPDYCLDGLEGVLDRLSNVHVFHWTFPEGKVVRRPLDEGAEAWPQYLEVVSRQGEDRFAMIEFVIGDSTEQLLADARTLKEWLAQVNERSQRDRVL